MEWLALPRENSIGCLLLKKVKKPKKGKQIKRKKEKKNSRRTGKMIELFEDDLSFFGIPGGIERNES